MTHASSWHYASMGVCLQYLRHKTQEIIAEGVPLLGGNRRNIQDDNGGSFMCFIRTQDGRFYDVACSA